MKKISTQSTLQMTSPTINRRHVGRGPKDEVLSVLRQFARAYTPLKNPSIPGIVLN